MDGEAHAEKAEENKLPGGLDPSSKFWFTFIWIILQILDYDSDGQPQRAPAVTSSSKNGQKPSNDKKASQNGKPAEVADVTKSKTKNEPGATNLTIIPTKRPQSAYENDGDPKSQPKRSVKL